MDYNRTSGKRKKELLLWCRNSGNLNLKIYYKWYCKILSKVIIAAKNVAIIDCKIWGFNNGDYKECLFLGWYAM
jgi:hypothetical protein